MIEQKNRSLTVIIFGILAVLMLLVGFNFYTEFYPREGNAFSTLEDPRKDVTVPQSQVPVQGSTKDMQNLYRN